MNDNAEEKQDGGGDEGDSERARIPDAPRVEAACAVHPALCELVHRQQRGNLSVRSTPCQLQHSCAS